MKIHFAPVLFTLLAAPAFPSPAPSSDAPAASAVRPISAACRSRATFHSESLAPSSQLTPELALMLTASFAQLYGQDITVSTVTPTGSMRPFFDENALLLLEAVPFSDLRLGDVVTFYHPRLHQNIVHRLIEKRDGVFWTKGDHNLGMDNLYVTPENFRRRLVGVVYMHPATATPALSAAPAATAPKSACASVAAH